VASVPAAALVSAATTTATCSASASAATTAAGRQRRVVIIGLLVLVLGGLVWGKFGAGTPDGGSARPDPSIAVLPFGDMDADKDQAYLSDGLAESLIYRLTQLPSLKVSPTNSVLRYKGKDTDIGQIAKELEVDAVMSGRLTQRGDDLTISVELTDARTKKLIWAEQYVRKMSDLLATQREIAGTVTQKLQLKLTGDDTKSLTKSSTNDNEAYQLYLKGRFFWNKRTAEGMKTGIEQLALAQDEKADARIALDQIGMELQRSTPEKTIVWRFLERLNTVGGLMEKTAKLANAIDKDPAVNPDALIVKTAFVDEGFRMKRVRPAPMGRAYRVQKRTCHITIQLGSVEE